MAVAISDADPTISTNPLFPYGSTTSRIGVEITQSPDLVTPVSNSPVTRVEAVPETNGVLPPIEPPLPPIERQKRGALYVRVLAAVGIGLTVLFLWQVLTKL